MVAPGARGNTQKQITESLSMPSLRKTTTVYRCLLPTFSSYDFTLSIANRIFLNEGFQTKKRFLDVLKESFHSSTKRVDFGQNEAAVKIINDWVAAETKDKIKNLVPANALNGGTTVVLVNAIYFRADWKYQFDKSKTREGNFFPDGPIPKKVPMMSLTSRGGLNVAYISSLKSRMLRLPYKGDRIVLDILLPNSKEKGALEIVEKTLEKNDILQEFERNKRMEEVEVKLPKFKIESTHDTVLEKAIENSGMTEMWCESGKSDFSGISEQPTCVTKVIQKAMIEVDEEGTIAAAASAVMMQDRSGGSRPPRFIADHPFLFFLRDLITG